MNRAPPRGAYIPPASTLAPPVSSAPVSVKAGDFEYNYQEFEIPQGSTPQQVYITNGTWNACDVHLSRPRSLVMLPNNVIAISIFALLPGGLRTLVATGRLENEGTILVDAGLPKWVAAARVPGVKYEVLLSFNNLINPGEKIGVTIVASNDPRDAPFEIGQLGLQTGFPALVPDSVARSAEAAPLLFCGIHAVNVNAPPAVTAVYACVFASQVPAPGDSALLAFAVPEGQSIYLRGDLLHGLRLRGGVCVQASSTPDVLTALAGALVVGGWYK